MLAAIRLMRLVPVSIPRASMYDGKPTFAEGTELGYYLWRDGDRWHLRWTTMGRMRGMKSGRAPVVATRGQDHIEMDGNSRILFNARTDDDVSIGAE